MTNYIPHHRKKKEILEKREYQLVKAISEGCKPEKIAILVKEVREAQIRVVNVKQSQIKPIESNKNSALIAKITKDYEYWNSLRDDEIIEIYKQKCT